ncbi:MAG: hypothetical protein FI729_06290 [SAR202 cluster bacterium]|nr:hypothetical protein [SAR202 cluster bacterium]
MPKNSRRIASKQAALGQKKRRSRKRPLDTNQENSNSIIAQRPTENETESTKDFSSITSTQPAANTTRFGTLTVDSKSNGDVGNINPHIWPEVKRILLVTTLIFTIMGGLVAFVR